MTDDIQETVKKPLSSRGLTEKLLRVLAGKSIRTTGLQDREKWLEQVLSDIPAGSRILDAGAGETQYRRFCQHLDYVSQDFAQYDGVGDSSGLQEGSWDNTKLDIVCDITAIPEPDESFDAVMCIEVLEHLPAPIETIRELSRLLRSGGQLILSAPFASLSHFAPYHFYSGFSQYFYRKWLEEFGLSIVTLAPNGNYFEYLCQELGRLRSVSKKYVKERGSLNLLDYLSLWVLLRTLKRFSKNDAGSDEVLCYGYHIVAVKTRLPKSNHQSPSF